MNWDWSWALDRINYWLSKIKSIIDQWLLETSRSSQVICALCRCMHEMNFYRCNLQYGNEPFCVYMNKYQEIIFCLFKNVYLNFLSTPSRI